MIQMILQTEEMIQNEIKTMKNKINEFYTNCKNHNEKMKEKQQRLRRNRENRKQGISSDFSNLQNSSIRIAKNKVKQRLAM